MLSLSAHSTQLHLFFFVFDMDKEEKLTFLVCFDSLLAMALKWKTG